MQLMRVKKELNTYTRNFNEGSHIVNSFGTNEEKVKWRSEDSPYRDINGSYSYEINITQINHDHEINVTKEYLEKKLPLRFLLYTIKRLAKGKSALSKSLFAYYIKAGTNIMIKDFQSIFKENEKIDVSDLSNRKYHLSRYTIYLEGEFMEHGTNDGRDGSKILFENLITKHLNRSLAILISKGYLSKESESYNRRLKGYKYNYSNTYYKLTSKAEKYLEK